MHWAKNWPHKTNAKALNVAETVCEDDSEDVEEVNIKLLTNKYEILINEMIADPIIDTTWTKAVSGKYWFHNNLKCLDDTGLNNVQIAPSKKTQRW